MYTLRAARPRRRASYLPDARPQVLTATNPHAEQRRAARKVVVSTAPRNRAGA